MIRKLLGCHFHEFKKQLLVGKPVVKLLFFLLMIMVMYASEFKRCDEPKWTKPE